jgi:hypothetical protein
MNSQQAKLIAQLQQLNPNIKNFEKELLAKIKQSKRWIKEACDWEKDFILE